MKYRTQYGLLDDFDAVIRWLDYPPANGQFIKRRLPIIKKPAPTIETHGLALW